MRRVVVALLIGLVLGRVEARAQSAEEVDTRSVYERRQAWFSRDKAFHFTLSAAGAATLYVLGRELGLDRWPAAIGATVVVGTAGFLREALAVHDSDGLFTREHFSRRDMAWNGAGIVVGITVSDRLLRRRWERDAPP